MTGLSFATRIAAIVATAMLLSGASARADEGGDYQKLLDSHQNAFVTIKFVLKMKMGGMFGGGDNESEQEVTGVMIDPKGTVLCSNTSLGGIAGMIGRMSSMFGDMQATPTDIKVLIGDDTDGVEAELMARDSELDLAWVQIKKPADKPYAAIDMSKSLKPKLGGKILAINKLGKYYGRAATVSAGRIAGMCKKPRELFIPSGGSNMGLPVFAEGGEIIGIAVMQMPEADGSDNPMAMMSMLGDLQSAASGFILPAEEVVKATARARERASEESAEKKDEAKGEEKADTKKEEKKDGD